MPVRPDQVLSLVINLNIERGIICYPPEPIPDYHNPSTRKPLSEVKILREDPVEAEWKKVRDKYRRLIRTTKLGIRRPQTTGACPNEDFYKALDGYRPNGLLRPRYPVGTISRRLVYPANLERASIYKDPAVKLFIIQRFLDRIRERK